MLDSMNFFLYNKYIELRKRAKHMKLFNRKPKDKIKVAIAFTLKGLTKQVIQLEQKGFIKQGEIQSAMFDGTNMGFQQAMIKKASE